MALVFAKRESLQKDATSCRPDRYGSCPLPSPVGQRDLQFFAPNDFELAQELPIPAVGLGVFGIVSRPLLGFDPRGVEHPQADGVPLTHQLNGQFR
jgi:hypothetical protein